MTYLASTLRNALASVSLAAACAVLVAGPAAAQQEAPTPPPAPSFGAAPQDLTKLLPIPKYTPKKTAWGDPDLRGTWPLDALGGLPMQRPASQANRVYLTDEEYATREASMERSRNAAAAETKSNKLGMGNWVEMTGAGRRTSLLIDPPDGRLPALTAEAKRAETAGRSSWVRGQTYDEVTDFDSWDRCISRGFPASMMAFHYNNGVRIFQAPGIVVVDLEMIHDSRIIYTDGRKAPPPQVNGWMGESRGHWEGNTLVVETTNIKPGAAPINAATIGGPMPAYNTIPMSPQAHVTERFTLAGPDTLVYEMTFNDPVNWTAPWTIREDIPRNEKYEFYEYACHEGDVQVRNYIVASRAQRAKDIAAGTSGITPPAPSFGPRGPGPGPGGPGPGPGGPGPAPAPAAAPAAASQQ